ncbi:MAG TPA: hypothetical protein VFL47_06420 [Flavisolibacter sp.]|nr:hypothetical protein [Flavisolibacter sp.]
MHFGSGEVQDANTVAMALYERVQSSCPTDGHYAFTSSTSGCFRGDWHTLTEDHTPGDVNGNMLLVNSAYESGVFFSSRIKGFKSATAYQFGVWLMNVCRPSDKCPYPLLPNLTILLQTLGGKTVARFATGDIPRLAAPYWTQHRAQFTVPAATTELVLVFINNAPGGCGNDLALDDITFRECVKKDALKVVQTKKVPPPVTAEKQKATVKKEVKKDKPVPPPVKVTSSIASIAKTEKAMTANEKPAAALPARLAPVPAILQQRTNTLAKQIETGAGVIQLDLYDNGEIDGDTVSIYHNNQLIVSQQRLSSKPISFRIQVDQNQPHHELVMVANNLGSIPPNTSLMIVTTKDKRYQVFISSTEQQNAKVAIDLKEQ